MGLRTWKGKIVRKGDVSVAKNYLDEGEIAELNRIVVMFLDHAEDQTRRRKSIHMAEWPKKLDAFLAFNERRVLPGARGTRREDADAHAGEEYERSHMLASRSAAGSRARRLGVTAGDPRPRRTRGGDDTIIDEVADVTGRDELRSNPLARKHREHGRRLRIAARRRAQEQHPKAAAPREARRALARPLRLAALAQHHDREPRRIRRHDGNAEDGA
jgi:hypothetical protein